MDKWICSCGKENTSKFCTSCGKSRPIEQAISNAAENTWMCSCGKKNTSKFCTACGKQRPEQQTSDGLGNTWVCSCGKKNTTKFCVACGKDRADNQTIVSNEWTCVCGKKNTTAFCVACGNSREGTALETTSEEGTSPEIQIAKATTEAAANDLEEKKPAVELEKPESEESLLGNQADLMDDNQPIDIDKFENLEVPTEKDDTIDFSAGTLDNSAEISPPTPAPKPSKKKISSSMLSSRKNLIIIGVASVIVGSLIGVAGVYFYLQNTENSKESSTASVAQVEETPIENNEPEPEKEKDVPKATSELSLGNISMGYTVDQVHEVLGKESEITDPYKNGHKRYQYPDIEVIFVNGKVAAFTSKTNRVSTIRGIHTGDSYQAVRKAYGVSKHEFTKDGITYYEYDFKSLDKKDCLLRFAIKNGVVDYISARVLTEEPKATANSDDAIKVLNNYWKAITNKNFEQAYGYATEKRQKQMGSIESFRAGHKDTISSKMIYPKVTKSTDSTAEISFSLEARDKIGSRVKLQTYGCSANMVKVNGTWKIDELMAKKNGERWE